MGNCGLSSKPLSQNSSEVVADRQGKRPSPCSSLFSIIIINEYLVLPVYNTSIKTTLMFHKCRKNVKIFLPKSRHTCCMQQWNRKSDEGIGCACAKLGQRSSVLCLFLVHASRQWMLSKFYYGSVFIVIKLDFPAMIVFYVSSQVTFF